MVPTVLAPPSTVTTLAVFNGVVEAKVAFAPAALGSPGVVQLPLVDQLPLPSNDQVLSGGPSEVTWRSMLVLVVLSIKVQAKPAGAVPTRLRLPTTPVWVPL